MPVPDSLESAAAALDVQRPNAVVLEKSFVEETDINMQRIAASQHLNKKLKSNVSIRNNELIDKPGRTLLSLKQVIVRRGKPSSKKEGNLCKQPSRVIINYLSKEGKSFIIKVSKNGSVNIWSASKAVSYTHLTLPTKRIV